MYKKLILWCSLC